MIIDSHCHLLHSKSEKMIPDIISDAKLNNVQVLPNLVTTIDQKIEAFHKLGELFYDISFQKENSKYKKWTIIFFVSGGINDLSLKRAEYAAIIKKDGFEVLVKKLEQKIYDLQPN